MFINEYWIYLPVIIFRYVCAHYCVPYTVSVSMGKTHNWYLFYMDTHTHRCEHAHMNLSADRMPVSVSSLNQPTWSLNVAGKSKRLHSPPLWDGLPNQKSHEYIDHSWYLRCHLHYLQCSGVCVCVCVGNGRASLPFRLQARTPAKTGGFRSCREQSLSTRRTSISRFNAEIFPEPKLKNGHMKVC